MNIHQYVAAEVARYRADVLRFRRCIQRELEAGDPNDMVSMYRSAISSLACKISELVQYQQNHLR